MTDEVKMIFYFSKAARQILFRFILILSILCQCMLMYYLMLIIM